MKELRQHPRITTSLNSVLNFQENNQALSATVTIKDISLGGFKLYLNNTLSPEKLSSQKFRVKIPFSKNSSEINEEVEIVWTHSHFAGVRFLNLSADSEKILKTIFPTVQELPPKAPSKTSSKVPHNTRYDYDEKFIQERRAWLEEKTETKLKHVGHYSFPTEELKGNIEQFIGVAQVPIGITGPLKITGEHAQGEYYVPLATTEGALVMTYNRGMRVLSEAGGVRCWIDSDEIHISPSFPVEPYEGHSFISWVQRHFHILKEKAEETTQHGKLLKIEPFLIGDRVVLKFVFYTADAHGLNMINKATEAACKYIQAETGKPFYQRSNFSSVKKASPENIHKGYGKSVFAEAVIPAKVLKLIQVTPQQMFDYYYSGLYSSFQAGVQGVNGHTANGIAAIFLACGQDIADVAMSHVGSFFCSITKEGDLRVNLQMPNILVGTVGGGTALGTQKECLELLGCYGAGKAKKFAEIVTATALAGELTVISAVITGTYVQAHEKYGRNKPKS